MARAIQVSASSMRVAVRDGSVHLEKARGSFMAPVVFRLDGTLWIEAALWARHLLADKEPATVARAIDHVATYAAWLESEGISWEHFPPLKKDRCLVRFRNALIRDRDAGTIAPSTATACMNAVLRFYRWANAMRLIGLDNPMFEERTVSIPLENAFGLQRTLNVQSTDLAIPNRRAAGAIQLEDGLLPVSKAQRKELLEFFREEASEEFLLMTGLGFATGMRLGSICDLKVATLRHADRCPLLGQSGWMRLHIGPGARPPVDTKFAVTGYVLIPDALLRTLLEYSMSERRLRRQALASTSDRDLLFLTRFGHTYSKDKSVAVHNEMSRLRKRATGSQASLLREFYFHRSRATFLTGLVQGLLNASVPVDTVLEIARDAALHRDVKTTLEYVRFVEMSKVQIELADEFTAAFLGARVIS